MKKNINIFVMDVDGTLTDGKIYMSNSGELFKVFDIKDGYAIHDILLPAHIIPVVITGRKSKIVQNRCTELGIEKFFQGVSDKVTKLTEILNTLETKVEEIAYIGDDLNDLPCMRYVKNGGGIVGCPANAVKEVKAIADFVSFYNGGDGAVREFVEYIKELNFFGDV